MNDTQIPPPGSMEAIAQGCRCPVVDNHYGAGRGEFMGKTMYVISGNCPLHDLEAIMADIAKELRDDQ